MKAIALLARDTIGSTFLFGAIFLLALPVVGPAAVWAITHGLGALSSFGEGWR